MQKENCKYKNCIDCKSKESYQVDDGNFFTRFTLYKPEIYPIRFIESCTKWRIRRIIIIERVIFRKFRQCYDYQQ